MLWKKNLQGVKIKKYIQTRRRGTVMSVYLEEEGRLEGKSDREKGNNGERTVYKEWPRSHRTSPPNSPCDYTHVHAVYHGTYCDTPLSGFVV